MIGRMVMLNSTLGSGVKRFAVWLLMANSFLLVFCLSTFCVTSTGNVLQNSANRG